MYQSVESFVTDYRQESESTYRLLSAITDESLGREVAPGYRTIGHLAWHLVPFGGILRQAGLSFDSGVSEKAEQPASAAAIAEAYRAAADAVIEAVSGQWTDERLQETATVFGMPWKNGFTLGAFVKHEVHHRGQLTVLMRQAGLPLIGVYGPTKDEWLFRGVEAPV